MQTQEARKPTKQTLEHLKGKQTEIRNAGTPGADSNIAVYENTENLNICSLTQSLIYSILMP